MTAQHRLSVQIRVGNFCMNLFGGVLVCISWCSRSLNNPQCTYVSLLLLSMCRILLEHQNTEWDRIYEEERERYGGSGIEGAQIHSLTHTHRDWDRDMGEWERERESERGEHFFDGRAPTGEWNHSNPEKSCLAWKPGTSNTKHPSSILNPLLSLSSAHHISSPLIFSSFYLPTSLFWLSPFSLLPTLDICSSGGSRGREEGEGEGLAGLL